MNVLRLFAITVVLIIGAVPSHAEIKNQWIDYTHGDTRLKGYLVYDDQFTGKRPAVLMIHAREDAVTGSDMGAAGLCDVRRRYLRLRRRCAAQGRAGDDRANYDLQQG